MLGDNYKIIETLNGGTNTPVYLIKADTKADYIIKQYGYESKWSSKLPRVNKTTWNYIVEDFIKLRSYIALAKVKIPYIHDIYYINDVNTYEKFDKRYQITSDNISLRLVIVETFCGYNILNILKENYNEQLISSAIDIIRNLPEGIEIDCNPKNFTVLDNDIYFVDFIPPKIKDYQNSKVLTNLFPSIELRTSEREARRNYRDTTNNGRIQKFKYYLEKEFNS